MSDHARLSLSHSDTWMVCAAWPRMVEGLGEEESPAIQFGNDSHEILEQMMTDPEFTYFTSEEASCADQAYQHIQARWIEMGVDCTTCLAEAEVKITSTNRKDLWGSADAVIYNDKELEIVDLKSGAGTYVDEKSSGQLKHYAIAAMETFNIKPPTVKLTIVQPRYWGSEPKIRTHTMTPDELYVWLAMEANPAAMATDDPNAEGTVTQKCKQCAGRHVCQYRDEAVADALTGGMGLSTIETAMEVQEVDIRKNQDTVVYDNERLSEVLMLIPVIRDYCDALEEHAEEVIMKGETVAGYKVVASSGRSKWLNEDDVREALNKTQVNKNAYVQKLKTPKQILALVPKTNKKLAKKLSDLVGKSGGGRTLVMNSDKRESLAPTFDVIGKPSEQIAIEGKEPEQLNIIETPAFLL